MSEESQKSMRSTLDKIETKRVAAAQAVLKLNADLVAVLESKSGPKGDALEIARVAGTMAGGGH